jgi:DNA-binding response OmpR family regulator
MLALINIVVVEDHLSLQELLVEALRHAGYAAVGFSSAEELDEYLVKAKADILVLDINLPGENGISIAARLSHANPALRIIMLTARSTEKDKLVGYENGADIYLTKPVSPSELLAAVGSIKRRIKQEVPAASFSMDCPKRQLLSTASGATVELSFNELSLLKGLVAAPGHKLDYWRLLDLLGKTVDEKSKAALGVQIHRLNLKMLPLTDGETCIKSNFKEGYQLAVSINISRA